MPNFTKLEIKANYTCNSRCGYCCISNNQGKRTMNFEEIAANILFFKETYKISEVCLSGGEPTIHREFLATLKFIKEQGLTTYLHTNAIRFHDRQFVKECAPFLNRVLVGFSYHDEAACDQLTGTTKTFARRLAGIKNLLDCQLPVRTNSVVLKSNFRCLPDMGRLIGDLGTSKALFTLPFFFEATARQVDQFVPEDFTELKSFLGEAIRLLEKKGVTVFLQGLPPCKLDEFKDYREVDPDRAFVDSGHQLDAHCMLFSDMLGYAKVEACRDCLYAVDCWGFPQTQALGKLGDTLSLS
ncbi:MAG: radical SAM protein [Deltaproteobacteria bacterium]|nr:radical SAM protein [Candidatus Anaeroferrophillus wilburensis]MBN2887900.1 radical SAM protein [Deltaproteobacteria bacterium]